MPKICLQLVLPTTKENLVLVCQHFVFPQCLFCISLIVKTLLLFHDVTGEGVQREGRLCKLWRGNWKKYIERPARSFNFKILLISYLFFPFYVNFCGHQAVSVSPLSFEAVILHIF